MTVQEFRDRCATGETVVFGSEVQKKFDEYMQEALKITAEMNGSYHTPDELQELFSRLTDSPADPTLGLVPPFYTDCGRNIHVGQGVFINTGCTMQDQGGIFIGDGALLGHHCTIATLNHDLEPSRRRDLIPRPVHIGKNVWIGANVTILPGVTIGDNAVIAAGAVVARDVPADTVAAGVPAKVIRRIEGGRAK